jgi:hypothetical protein
MKKPAINQRSYTAVFLKQLGIPLTKDNLRDYSLKWWYNNRDKMSGGLRLSDDGLIVLGLLDIKTYEIPYPKSLALTAEVMIFLDQFIDCPYHLSNRSITVTSDRRAVELSLFSGDIRKYGLAKAMTRSSRILERRLGTGKESDE